MRVPSKRWLWKGRRVLAYDGSTVSMPDTAENQQVYPQPPQQQPGLGFPLARIAAFFSLSCGAVIDLAICSPYAARATAKWECFTSCGASCVQAILCLPTATCVPGTKSICSSSVESTRSLVSIIAAESTSGAVSVWARAIILSSGAALVAFARSTGKPSNHFPSDSRFVKRTCEFSSLASAAEA